MKKILILLLIAASFSANAQRKLFGLDLNATPTLDFRVAVGKVGSPSENMTMQQLLDFTTLNLDVYTQSEVDDLFTNYIAKNNLLVYTPTQNYHPATKKYVDDGGVIVPWVNLTANASTIITRGKVSQVGKMITITCIFELNTVTANTTILTIPNSIGTSTVNIDFIAGDRDSEGEEVLELYIPIGTRTIKLREAGNTPNDYTFTVTYPAI